MKTRLLIVVFATACVAPSFSYALTYSFSDLIVSPTRVVGFESAGTRIDQPSAYIEDGVFISQIGQSSSDWINLSVMPAIYPAMGFDGLRAWYPNGGDYGFTRISLVDHGVIESISLLVGNGHGDIDGVTGITGSTVGNWGERVFLNYVAYLAGSQVASGSIRPTGVGATSITFLGGGFDTLDLNASYESASPSSGKFQALALDDIKIASAVPEPSSLMLLVIGLLLLIILVRSRRRI